MLKSRTETWLALIVLGVGLLVTAILGLFAYIFATAAPLHPNPQDVPSVTHSAPLPKWADAVEQGRHIVRAALTERNLPGLSVAVGAGTEIVWAEGFGWADIDKRVPVAPHMRFRIGTASTALTSAAVGLLLEKDRLKLDEKIQTYVPEFPEKRWPVTLRQLMGHLAGVRSDDGDEGPLFTVRCERPVDALQYFKDNSLWFEPGTKYRFSNYGWILVSAAVEDATGERFLSFVRRQIFEPLGMDHTEADSATEPIPDRAAF
jgi:serine beta-lactamase-like protein LACTB